MSSDLFLNDAERTLIFIAILFLLGGSAYQAICLIRLLSVRSITITAKLLSKNVYYQSTPRRLVIMPEHEFEAGEIEVFVAKPMDYGFI